MLAMAAKYFLLSELKESWMDSRVGLSWSWLVFARREIAREAVRRTWEMEVSIELRSLMRSVGEIVED